MTGRGVADCGKRNSEHLADPIVRVMRLRGRDNASARSQPARNPQRFEIRHGAAAGEMPERLLPAEDGTEFPDALFLHFRTGSTAIEGVIVGIDPQGHCVGEPCNRVRRLEHLPGITRVKIRKVVVHAGGDLPEHVPDGIFVELRCKIGQLLEAGREHVERFAQYVDFASVDHPASGERGRGELTAKCGTHVSAGRDNIDAWT